jgi:hypothetical protein
MKLPVDEQDLVRFAATAKVMVHNGQMANLWFFNWLSGGAPAIQFPELYQHSKRKKRLVAQALTNDQWIRDVMHDLTVPLLEQFVKLWGFIEDAIIWTRMALGEYTAKSAYEMQFEGGIFSCFPKAVWKVWALTKCKFFLWLFLQNRVWTTDRLLLENG